MIPTQASTEKVSYQIEKMGAATYTDYGVVFLWWTMDAGNAAAR